jgi:4-hydroxy-2-oxoheptanedioate aldolase
MSVNVLRASLRDGHQALGGWLVMPDSLAAETVARCGFDYVGVDMQHGLADYGHLPAMIAGIQLGGATPIVRVPVDDLATVQRALDAGAEGIIVPLCESATAAGAAVAACRYAPRGARSFGPSRSRMYLGADPAAVNDQVLCFVMVETVTGLERVAEIAATPDLDGIYVGPSDLAISLGVPMSSDDPRLLAALAEILAECQRHDIIPAIHAPSGAAAANLIDQGFAMATISNDATMLRSAYQRELDVVRDSKSDHAAPGIYG